MRLEKAEIENALAHGIALINDEGENDADAIKAKIFFYEQELEKWKAKLSNQK